MGDRKYEVGPYQYVVWPKPEVFHFEKLATSKAKETDKNKTKDGRETNERKWSAKQVAFKIYY